jgi:hypothetical protein
MYTVVIISYVFGCYYNEKYFRKNYRENKRYTLSSKLFLWDNEEKYGTVGQTTVDNIIRRMGFACWIIKVTDTH